MSEKKNTLLFTLEFPPRIGGVSRYYEKMYRHMNDLLVLTVGKGEDERVTRRSLLLPHWLMGIFYLWREVKKNNINTVIIGNILPLGTVAMFLAKIIKFDYVVILHGLDFSLALDVPRKRKLTEKILKNAKKIIAANSYVARQAAKIVNKSKVAVVNPGVDYHVMSNDNLIEKLRNDYELHGKKVMLQVGRLIKRKGYDMVIEAMPIALAKCPDLIYVIIGKGPEKNNLATMAKNIRRDVIIIDDADDQEVQAWFELCHLFIMPARNIDGDYEGFGIVYLEANAHGKPVIAGKSGGVRDAVKDGLNGLLVNPESAEEISDAIIKLYKDEEFAQKLGEQGRQRIKEFSWRKQVEKIENVL
ncbi:MAG: glycosyltransferase family 4 protein [bacterium]|nr:glycosyltransferase family 4 protein [bacterium]